MSKLISTGTLSTFYDGIKDSIKDEEDRAKAVEESLQAAINTLNDNKLNTNAAVSAFIQSAVSSTGEVYDVHTLYKEGRVISPLVNIGTVIDDDGTQSSNHMLSFQNEINELHAAIGDGSALLTDAKDTVVACINELQTEINTLNEQLETEVSDLDGAITNEESRAKAEEGALAERISTVETNKADANDLNRYQLIQDDALQTANKRIPDAINELQSEIIDEASRAKAEEQALSRSIDTLSSNKADNNALNSYQLIQDNALDTSNKRIPDAINELKSAIDSNKTDVNSKISGINTSIN